MLETFLIYSLSACTSIFVTRMLIPFAPKLGLIDRPSNRKKHTGNIPLVGGLGIYISILICSMIFTTPQIEILSIITVGGILTTIGTLDDKYGLSPRFRLFIQFLAGTLLAYFAGIELKQLGDLVSLGSISLGLLSIPLTATGIAALANAYNMTDGIDGLAASLGIVAFGFLIINLGDSLNSTELLVLSFYTISLLTYLLFNFAVKPFTPIKVFMGDAGSMFIGFSIAAFCIYFTQNDRFSLKPITSIWFVAIPLFDMVATMIRRMRKGQSPFYPDRTHIHHLLMHIGFSQKQALLVIILISILLGAIGTAISNQPEHIQFISFCFMFSIYLTYMLKAWRIKKLFRRKI
jgi:UDP-GlcNAc:undecaprenyl-phosphate GlcNAc-1-phosphate transferase